MSNIINLPVSLGEAIDKLTILEIKLENIKDSRKLEVKNEYDILYNQLYNIIEKYKSYYNLMKQINLDIWYLMDKLRDETNINLFSIMQRMY